jgi:hypothetical protein
MPSRSAARTQLSLLAAVTAGALALGPVAPADATPGEAAAGQPVVLTLPAPTGPHRMGTVSLHLIDPTDRDPWVPDHPVRS